MQGRWHLTSGRWAGGWTMDLDVHLLAAMMYVCRGQSACGFRDQLIRHGKIRSVIQ